jgi:hypothetical protein
MQKKSALASSERTNKIVGVRLSGQILDNSQMKTTGSATRMNNQSYYLSQMQAVSSQDQPSNMLQMFE